MQLAPRVRICGEAEALRERRDVTASRRVDHEERRPRDGSAAVADPRA